MCSCTNESEASMHAKGAFCNIATVPLSTLITYVMYTITQGDCTPVMHCASYFSPGSIVEGIWVCGVHESHYLKS